MKPDQASSFEIATGVCVEVGTWKGEFSEYILAKDSVKKLYCVDPYKHFTNNEYPDAINNATQEEFDSIFTNLVTKLKKKFDNKVEFIRQLSTEAVKSFEDNSLDFVYIDGNNDYSYVLEDLNAWYPKIKKGGYLCGDDVYSQSLSEHDSTGNITMVWSHNCWGKYGTYKALLDFKHPFNIVETQFSILKE